MKEYEKGERTKFDINFMFEYSENYLRNYFLSEIWLMSEKLQFPG